MATEFLMHHLLSLLLLQVVMLHRNIRAAGPDARTGTGRHDGPNGLPVHGVLLLLLLLAPEM